MSVAGIIQVGTQARVYNRESTLFWKEKWLGDALLIEECLRPLDTATSFKLVKEYWDFRRGWKWEELEGLLSPSTLSLLGSKILRNDEGGEDGLCWVPSIDGSFSVKSAYELGSPAVSSLRINLWGKIWKINTPQRMKTLMWALLHDRLMTNQERCRVRSRFHV